MPAVSRTDGPTRQVRVKTGCLTCRARKVKCDETPDVCLNCSKLSIDCRWGSDSSHGEVTARSYVSTLRPSACIACRLARARCSHDRPTCRRCMESDRACEYPGKRKRKGRSDSQEREDTSDGGVVSGGCLPCGERLEKLVGVYFVNVHPYQANAFLHRTSILQAIRSGGVSESVLLAICAIAARFVEPPEPSAKLWAERAAEQVILSGQRSIDTVTTAIILATYAHHCGAFKRAEMLCCIAIRQALAMGLHRESGSENRSWIEGEGRRRLLYACYCLERLLSDGAPDSTQVIASRIKIQLPCDGICYRLGIQTETPVPILEETEGTTPFWLNQNLGTMGQYIRIIGIRHMTQRYLFDLSEDLASQPPPWDEHSVFAKCLEKLSAFRSSLGTAHRLTPEAISKRYDAPIFGSLVMIYLWWNALHVKLFRVALPGYPQSLDHSYLSMAPASWLSSARDSCLQHAIAITSLLEMVQQNLPDKTFIIRDPYVAHLVYVSIRAQLDSPGCDAKSFDAALGFVERAARLFEPVRHIYCEIRALLARRGYDSGNHIPLYSRVGSPNPIFDAQLLFERQAGLPSDPTLPQDLEAWVSGWSPDLDEILGLEPSVPTTDATVPITQVPCWQGQVGEAPSYGVDPFLPNPASATSQLHMTPIEPLQVQMASWLAPLMDMQQNADDPEAWMKMRWAGA